MTAIGELPIGHSGHWLPGLLVFVAPIALIVLWIACSSRRAHRRGREQGDSGGEESNGAV